MKFKGLFSARTLLLSFIMLSPVAWHASAQNLVPNGDFESYNNCPTDLNGGNGGTGYVSIANSPGYTSFPTVKNWVTTLLTTPDYMNTCATAASNVSAPKNWCGYQNPHSGNGYVGLLSYYGGSSEYVSAKLKSPLVKDSTYRISFFVSPAEFGIGGSATQETIFAINEFGAHISKTLPSVSDYHLNLPFTIGNDTNRHLTDTTAWYEIAGNYTAEGGEQWITIGCFFDKNIPARTVIVPRQFGGTGYCFVDDVSVMAVSKLDAKAPAGVSGLQGLRIFPNPAKNFIQINGLGKVTGNKTISISGVDGKELKRLPVTDSDLRIDISSLPQGVYLLRIQTMEGTATYRILK